MKNMKNRRGQYWIAVFLLSMIFGIGVSFFHTVSVRAKACSDVKRKLTVVLDPGHGGRQSGAARDNEQTEEKTLNLKIAKYLKTELERYENVEVFMTRTGDFDVELEDRTAFAVDKKADVMVSIHNNAAGACAAYDHGCTVLAAKDGYKDVLALEEQKLSCNILNELTLLGIENQGILLRDSEANERYPNGELADYYAIIRGGVLNDIPTVLIEHAFIDNDNDYEKYLSTDRKLKKLAIADARGIARYYQLVKKGKDTAGKKCELEPLVSYKEKLVHAVDGNGKHNKISYRTYYDENDKATSADIEVFQKINAFIDENGMIKLKDPAVCK